MWQNLVVGAMWKKGSYDVSGRQHDSNRLSVVVLSNNHHGGTVINFEKNGPSAWKRLKWFSEIRNNLSIQLVSALLLVIFFLIGVIIWLSVSIHLSNRDNFRAISTAMDLLTGQNVNNNMKPEPCSTDVLKTGKNRGIPCDILFRAAFEFTERMITVDEEIDSEKSFSMPSFPTGTTTIRSTTRETFSLKGTSYQMKLSRCNNCQMILQRSPINKTGENQSPAESDSEEDTSDEIDEDGMGKKKGYNVAIMDSKLEEDKKTEKKESFTVQDYDAIANETMNDEPCKQLNAADSDSDEIDDDSSSDSHHSDTQDTNAIEPVSYKDDQLKEAVNNQSTKAENASTKQQRANENTNLKASEQNTSTNTIEPASKTGGGDDDQLNEDVNNQSTKGEDDTKSNLDDKASTKQQSATENSNLKNAEQYTSIDLGEIKHAPKNKSAKNWVKRNLFCVIGIAVVVGLIAIISVAASSRKKPTSDDKDELMARKGHLPDGFQPATDEIDHPEDYNTKTNSTASSFEPTTNEMTTHGTNGNNSHPTEIQHGITTSAGQTVTPTVEIGNTTTEDDDDYYSEDTKITINADSGSGDASFSLFNVI